MTSALPHSPAALNRGARRHALRLAALLALFSLCPPVLARSDAPVSLPSTAAQASASSTTPLWGHEQVGRAPDPAVRFGRLPNGLRYAVQRNETPKDGVAMRLYIGAGSMAEREEEQGLAHFLEHMAFRGSKHLADGELVRLTERQGLRLGPDTNAFTSHDQTVYQFNFPRADAAALDTGLTLFREIGEHLLLDAAKVDAEKGVILSEERARDVVPFRAVKAEYNNLLAGSRFASRWPIGQVGTIQAATPERLRRFYQAHYRPEKAAIVVVGPVDVDAVEREIRSRFASWQPSGPPDAPDLGRPAPAAPTVEFVADGVAERLSLSWLQPPDLRPDTEAVEREHLLAQLAVGVLNQRLGDRALQPGSPFLGAGASWQASVNRLAQVAQLGVTAPPAQWRAALDTVLEELRRLLQDGVQAADLQRLVPGTRSQLEAAVASASTRQSAQIADALVSAAHHGGVYTSAAQDLAQVGPLLDQLSPAALTQALRQVFAGQGPVLFRAAKADAAGTQALAQQLALALNRPLPQAQASTAVVWPYTDFGAPSAVLQRQNDPDLGSTTVRWANGTVLHVKPTAQEKDRVQVQVRLGQGRSGLAAEHTHALWALSAFPLGGTGQLSQAQLLQWQQTSGRLVGVGLSPNLFSFSLGGATRPADLATQLQLLAAYARDPGFRPELGDKLGAAAPMVASQIEANAGAVFSRLLGNVTVGGEPRLASVPNAADLAATRPDDVAAVLRPALGQAATVFVVGDTTVDAAVTAVQATFGAGPERPNAPRLALAARLPAPGTVHSATHGGRADQAVLGLLWALPDGRSAPALRPVAQVAAALVQTRLTDTVREQLGITYSPSASASMGLDLPGDGHFAAQIETPPDKFDTFRQILQQQLRQLADQPVGADELQRARQPLVAARRKAPENNGFWMAWLTRLADQPGLKPLMQGEVAALEAVTAEQVQALVRTHLVDKAPVEVRGLPR